MTPEDQVELEHRLTVLEEESKQRKELDNDVREMLKKFDRYENRWGTIVMIGAACWALIIGFKEEILKFLGWGK